MSFEAYEQHYDLFNRSLSERTAVLCCHLVDRLELQQLLYKYMCVLRSIRPHDVQFKEINFGVFT